MHPSRLGAALFLSTLFIGCSSEALDETGAPGDATLSATLVKIYDPGSDAQASATALAFSATTADELWITLRQFPSGLPCTSTDDRGCSALPGAVAVISGATGDSPQVELKQDGNAWHFMRRPSSIAWGDGLLFGSCGEALTDNYEDVAIPYAGPVLWSSDPAIFGVEPGPDQNGTHLDMLHETPYCMGIAHESDNVFWVFNGDAGSLDRVDFHTPHQIGGEDHSDGEVHRYLAGQLSRVAEVPSHLAYDTARALLYAVDTGHGRVLSVDPSTATPSGKIDVWEVLQASGAMEGATVRELVPPGKLQRPSGIVLDHDLLYVTDNSSSLIYVYDTAGKLQRTIDTALSAGSLAGIALGPDGKIYVTNLLSGDVLRVEVSGD